MRALIGALADTRPAPWNVVVVVGAGSGAWLPLLRRLEAKRLVILEPLPELAALLERSVDRAHGEEVRASALVDSGAPSVTLHVCNNSRLSGLSPPTRLMELLPNLQLGESIQVSAVSLEVLASELKLELEQRNLLILDAPGQLAALRNATGLSRFSDIVLHAASEPLYEGDAAGEQLDELIAKAGFEAWATDPEGIYPFTRRAFRRNDALLHLLRLRHSTEAELTAARYRVHAAEDRARKLNDALESLSSKLDAAREQESQSIASIAELQDGLQKARDTIKSQEVQSAALTRQLDERDLEIAELKDREKRMISAAKAEMDKIRDRLAEVEAELVAERASHRSLRQKHARTDEDLKSATADRDNEARKNEQGSKQLEHLKQRLNELDDQLINARDAMALAIRMQTLRENDLNELRERYAQLHGRFQAQCEVLKKLSERLVAANEYFQQLAGSDLPQGGSARMQARESLPPGSSDVKPNDELRGHGKERKG